MFFERKLEETESELTLFEIHRDELFSKPRKGYEKSMKRMEIPPAAIHERTA